jgi:hypothetical protein
VLRHQPNNAVAAARPIPTAVSGIALLHPDAGPLLGGKLDAARNHARPPGRARGVTADGTAGRRRFEGLRLLLLLTECAAVAGARGGVAVVEGAQREDGLEDLPAAE